MDYEALSNTMKLDGIPRRSTEYKGAVQKYQEARQNTKSLWRKNRVNSCPDSGCTKLGEKTEGWCQTRPRPGANAVKCHQKGSPRPPKAHQKGTKLMPKRAKIAKMTPDGNSIIFFTNIGSNRGAHSAPILGQNLIKYRKKAVRESALGKYQQIIVKGWRRNDDKILS